MKSAIRVRGVQSGPETFRSPPQKDRDWSDSAVYLSAVAVALLPFLLTMPSLGRFYLGNPGCDIATYRSYLHFTFETLRSGEIPWWCPHTFCGTVFFPSTHATMYSPINFPLLLLLPQPLSVNLCILANAILFATGTAWYLRRNGQSGMACVLGAALAVSGGVFISRVYAGHFTIVSTLSWFPWVLGRFEILISTPTVRNTLLFSATSSFMYFGGHSQYAYYASLLLTTRLLIEVWARRTNIRKIIPRLGGALLGGTVLTAGLAAVELVPVLHATLHSARSSATGEDWTRFFSFPPEALLNFFTPGALGIHPNYYGRWYWWELVPYFGVAGLCLALGNLCVQLREKSLSAATILLIVSLGLSCAVYIPIVKQVLSLIPGWGLFRGHAKLGGLAGWFGCVLAAGGLDRLRQSNSRLVTCFVISSSMVLCLTVAGLLFTATDLPLKVIQSDAVSSERMHRLNMDTAGFGPAVRANLTLYWVLAAAFSAAALLFITGILMRGSRYLSGGLAVVLVVDLLVFAIPVLGRMLPANAYHAPVAFWKFAAERASTDRADAPGSYYESQSFGAFSEAGQDINVSQYYNTYLAAIEGESPAFPQLTFGAERDHPLLDLANVTLLALPQTARISRNSAFRREAEFGSWTVFRRPTALPRAYVVTGSKTSPADELSIHQALMSGTTNYRREVLLSGTGAVETPGNGREYVAAAVTYSGTRNITVQAPASGWLVLTESFYPLWRASVGGESRQIIRANGAFRAVRVTAGEQVRFTMDTRLFSAAAMLSALCWTLMFATLLGLRIRRVRHPVGIGTDIPQSRGPEA